MGVVFLDRRDAGRQLAQALRSRYAPAGDLLVLGLPRGGVVVAYQVALALEAELDVIVVRKLGLPGHEELAMGALALGGVRVINEEVVRAYGVEDDALDAVANVERAELLRRERVYRGDRAAPRIEGRSIVLVDDGIATGSTMRAAIQAAKIHKAAYVAVAVPVAPPHTVESLARQADDVVCLSTPDTFFGLSQFYADFAQTRDADVCALLAEAWSRRLRV